MYFRDINTFTFRVGKIPYSIKEMTYEKLIIIKSNIL